MGSLFSLFRQATGTREKQVVMKNFFSLSLLQTASYILPLLTLPYLLRVLGPEKFGLIAFADSFTQYFAIFTDYGFSLPAVREISINRGDARRVGEIYSAITALKGLFLAASLVVLTLLVFAVPRFSGDWAVYFLSFGSVVGQCLFPVWFFQGMERMKYITILSVSAKTFFTVSIFVFVRNSGDYLFVPLLQGCGYLMMGAMGLWVAHRDFGVRFRMPGRESMLYQLREGWHIFVSRISMSLYATSSTFILGLFSNNTVVGYYSAGEKVIRAAQRPIAPISDAVFPYISKLASQSKDGALNFIRKLIIVIGSGTLAISLAILLFAPAIGALIFGGSYGESIQVLRILAFVPSFATMSTLLGTQTMLTFNLKEEFSRILVAAGAFNLVLTFALAPRYLQNGVAAAVLATEIFVVAVMAVFLRSRGLLAPAGEGR